jgi:hypothetical protein
MEDDIVPLSKPYIDKAGKSHNSLLSVLFRGVYGSYSLTDSPLGSPRAK